MSQEELVLWFLKSPEYLFYAVALALLLALLLAWYFLAYFFNSLRKDKVYPKGKIKYKYAVLIPARNESKVIPHILETLKKQTYPKKYFDVFVIVESKDDPTVEITKSFGYEIVLRKDLRGRKTKGYALDDAYHYIKEKGYKYDAYMVFDADNLLNPDYIDLLNDCKNQGFKVGMGYRNFTNASCNWISACSATLFAYMNQFTSKGRSALFKKMTLTGTGYYVDADIIEDANGWIFNGMTEDVELTTYCYYNNISMNYYPIAQYFDEQPTTYEVVHKQHIRWVFGFFTVDKELKIKKHDYKCLKKGSRKASIFEFRVSLIPLVVIVILLALAMLASMGIFIASLCFLPFMEEFRLQYIPVSCFLWVVVYFFIFWIAFAFISFITFIISNKYLKFKKSLMIKVIISYSFFFCDFLFAFIDGLLHKEKRKTRDKIDHEGKILDQEALKNVEK